MFFDRNAEPGQHRPLLAFILASLVVGAAGTLFTEPAIPTWYAALAKPDFTPPNWLFAPVWTVLYVLMAIAAWRVWRVTDLKAPELFLWMAQLTLNFLWSAIFFSLHLIFFALAASGSIQRRVTFTLPARTRTQRSSRPLGSSRSVRSAAATPGAARKALVHCGSAPALITPASAGSAEAASGVRPTSSRAAPTVWLSENEALAPVVCSTASSSTPPRRA